MDWLNGMNKVITQIEAQLHEPVAYDALAQIVGCSVYEFHRVFSFITGMSVSEYVRHRRLSQAAFDLQNSDEKIIDIALRYGYESPTSFTKAFKELHGTTPSAAKRASVPLKTYPPLSFTLTIKGVNEMNFRMEKRDIFPVVGAVRYATVSDLQELTLPSIWSVKAETAEEKQWAAMMEQPGEYELDTPGGKIVATVAEKGVVTIRGTADDGTVWEQQIDARDLASPKASITVDGETYGVDHLHYSVAAFDFHVQDGKVKIMIGAEPEDPTDLSAFADADMLLGVPAADWAVFSFTDELSPANTSQAYTRILAEWFPLSGYRRNESAPHLERTPYGPGAEALPWEIWIPVLPA